MSNATTLDSCGNAVAIATFFDVFLQMVVVNFMIFVCTLWRIYTAREYLKKHKIFILYFISLLLGNIIAFFVGVIGFVNLQYLPPVESIVDLLGTIGVSLFQIFFTLVPNFYFAVMKTKLTTLKKKTTHEYFYINLSVSAFFIIFMILSCVLWTFIVTNVLQVIETIYSIGFYSVALWKVRKIEKKSQKKLWLFFNYYLLFVVVNITGNVSRALDVEGNYLTGIHHVDLTIILLTVVLTLKQMKLQKRENSQSASSSQSEKKQPSQVDNNVTISVQ